MSRVLNSSLHVNTAVYCDDRQRNSIVNCHNNSTMKYLFTVNFRFFFQYVTLTIIIIVFVKMSESFVVVKTTNSRELHNKTRWIYIDTICTRNNIVVLQRATLIIAVPFLVFLIGFVELIALRVNEKNLYFYRKILGISGNSYYII